MQAASRIAAPLALVFLVRSLPARSTRVSLDTWRPVRTKRAEQTAVGSTIKTQNQPPATPKSAAQANDTNYYRDTANTAAAPPPGSPPPFPPRPRSSASPARRRTARGCGTRTR
jgi:hypothetical protein